MKNYCQYCGEELFGRRDKKYCNDYCRSAAHKKANREEPAIIKRVNSILKKNRDILVELNPKGKMKIKREKLLLKGFDINYFTNTYVTKTGKEYRFCYDQGFVELDDDWLALVVKQEYVN